MKKVLIFAILSLVMLHSSAMAKEQLTWLVLHWPPLQMLEGVDKGKGKIDALMNLYRENLPQYEHKTIKMNSSRFWNDLKAGKNICSIFSIKTEKRLQFAEFSEKAYFVMPLRIIMKKSNIDKLKNPESMSMKDLLRDSRFKGVFTIKRSYNTQVDDLIKKYQTNIEIIPIRSANIIQMLLTERTDYTIEYPFIASYLAGQYQDEYTTKLGSIGIKELPGFSIGHLACTKNDWGKKVIKDFNSVLKRVKSMPEYLEIMQMWHTDQQELEIIDKAFKEEFLQKD